MTLPPFVYSLQFWKALSFIAEGVLILLVYFGVLPDSYLLTSAAVLAWIVGFLNFLGVNPEVREKGFTSWRKQ